MGCMCVVCCLKMLVYTCTCMCGGNKWYMQPGQTSCSTWKWGMSKSKGRFAIHGHCMGRKATDSTDVGFKFPISCYGFENIIVQIWNNPLENVLDTSQNFQVLGIIQHWVSHRQRGIYTHGIHIRICTGAWVHLLYVQKYVVRSMYVCMYVRGLHMVKLSSWHYPQT